MSEALMANVSNVKTVAEPSRLEGSVGRLISKVEHVASLAARLLELQERLTGPSSKEEEGQLPSEDDEAGRLGKLDGLVSTLNVQIGLCQVRMSELERLL